MSGERAHATARDDGTGDDEVVLFDGSGTEGWRMCGDGRFEVVDGTLETQGGMGLLWYADRSFDDFVLRLRWRAASATANSGVFVRFPDPGDDPWVAVHHGYEVQILDEADEPERRTGAVYSFRGPTSVPTRPPGEWNDLAVTCRGQRYDVAVNGVAVTSFVGDRARRGFVGLQNHDDGSVVRFSGVRVRPLPGP